LLFIDFKDNRRKKVSSNIIILTLVRNVDNATSKEINTTDSDYGAAPR
jgi:hypothetical protein